MQKKIVFIIAALVVSMSLAAQSAQAIKIGPLGFLIGSYNLRYERAIDFNSSFQLSANYYNFKLFGIATNGYGADVAYRYYFKESLKGVYVAPVLGLAFNETYVSKNSDVKGKFSYLGLGATVGYQIVSHSGFVTDLGIGYGYNIELGKDDNLISSYSFAVPKFTLAIGYKF